MKRTKSSKNQKTRTRDREPAVQESADARGEQDKWEEDKTSRRAKRAKRAKSGKSATASESMHTLHASEEEALMEDAIEVVSIVHYVQCRMCGMRVNAAECDKLLLDSSFSRSLRDPAAGSLSSSPLYSPQLNKKVGYVCKFHDRSRCAYCNKTIFAHEEIAAQVCTICQSLSKLSSEPEPMEEDWPDTPYAEDPFSDQESVEHVLPSFEDSSSP